MDIVKEFISQQPNKNKGECKCYACWNIFLKSNTCVNPGVE